MLDILSLHVPTITEQAPSLCGKTSSSSYRVFADVDSIQRRLPDWKSWQLKAAAPEPFVCWDFYLNWLKHFDSAYDEIVFLEVHLSVDEAPEDTCVFPMVRKGRFLELAGYTLADFQDAPTNEPDRMRDFVDLLLTFADRHRLTIAFSKVPDHGSLKYELIRRAERINAPLVITPLGPCPYFDIEGKGLDDALARFGKSTRKGIRRRLRNFDQDFGIDFELNEGVTEEFLDIASELHRKLQVYKPGDSIFDQPGLRPFLQDISNSPRVGLTSALLRDRLGKPIGFELGFVGEETYFAWLSAYDPDYSDFRPGTCTMASLIDELSRRGVKTFDLLCGAELYKYQYAKDEHFIHGLTIYPNRFCNHVRARLRRWVQAARTAVKMLAIRTGMYKPNYRV